MKAQVEFLEAKSLGELFKDSNGAATIGVMRWGIDRIEAAQAAEQEQDDGEDHAG